MWLCLPALVQEQLAFVYAGSPDLNILPLIFKKNWRFTLSTLVVKNILDSSIFSLNQHPGGSMDCSLADHALPHKFMRGLYLATSPWQAYTERFSWEEQV
jgi:hypothetical protein